jgi:hypothetical protein
VGIEVKALVVVELEEIFGAEIRQDRKEDYRVVQVVVFREEISIHEDEARVPTRIR